MALAPGTRLGSYEVLSPLGAGAMGEVYLARDRKLNRDVALKVLPPAFTANADRLARFEREAQLLASLNHPHIGSIYGFEDADHVPALVLELVEGDTLDERVRRGALPLPEALAIAQQIADALDAAHVSGIIHRDLKPSNIKITRDGMVKVLDFGLAKALAPEASGPDLAKSSTLTVEGTIPGAILGTAAYMSPEQARGQPLDKRTDVWAFGCVLFEMLTGSRAFLRETITDTIAAVVTAEPDWTLLPAETPGSIRRLLARCLQKDVRRRLHDIADARIELEDAMSAPSVPVTARASRDVGPPDTHGAGARDGDGPCPPLGVARQVRNGAAALAIGCSRRPPHGSSWPRGVSSHFIRRQVGGVHRRCGRQTTALRAAHCWRRAAADHVRSGRSRVPRWSPDSSSILYFSPAAPGELQGSIWEIPALGGVPRRVVNSVGGADVSPTDGRLALFRLAKTGIQLVTVPTDGSKFDVVAEFRPATYYLYPRWSPDGRWVAFQRGDSIRFDVFVVPAAGGEPRQLTRDNNMMSGFAWLPDSTGIVYSSSRGGTMPYLPALGLWQVALSDGSVRRVTSGEASYVSPDISKSGAILVSRMKLQTDIWKFPVDGSPAENVGHAVRITRQTGQVLTPTASPRDNEVAFLSDSGGHANLWVVNTESGGLRQITHERDPNVAMGVPVWSPDGRAIAFVYSRGNQGWTFGVWLVDPDGSNLRNIANPGLGPAWSPDGRWVYYSTRGGAASHGCRAEKGAG